LNIILLTGYEFEYRMTDVMFPKVLMKKNKIEYEYGVKKTSWDLKLM